MTWEYMTLTVETGGLLGGSFDADALTTRFNELGSEGWELVSTFDTKHDARPDARDCRHHETW